MIKAIFFDWFNTLAAYDPPREQLYCSAFKEFGKEISFVQAYRGLLEGDRQYFSLVSRGLVKSKNKADTEDVLTLYPEAICNVAGVSASPEVKLKVIRQVLKQHTGRMALFKDVLPSFEELKNKNYILGIITNADASISRVVDSLGLRPYLRAVITSEQVGAVKPNAAIFKAAYAQADLKPQEMAYVGDTYKSDIVGANEAGSLGILIDRYDLGAENTNCPRITTLSQLLVHIK